MPLQQQIDPITPLPEILSVPSVGAMPLQHTVPVEEAAGVVDFQSPQSGLCLCSVRLTSKSSLHLILSVPSVGAMPLQRLMFARRRIARANFQSPQSGLCLCSSAVIIPSIALSLLFQSPQSGLCLCSISLGLARQNGTVLSVPSVGAMPLQLYSVGQTVTSNPSFSPLSRGYASAAHRQPF